MASTLEYSGIRKTFGSAVALESFDLAMEPGELVSLLAEVCLLLDRPNDISHRRLEDRVALDGDLWAPSQALRHEDLHQCRHRRHQRALPCRRLGLRSDEGTAWRLSGAVRCARVTPTKDSGLVHGVKAIRLG